MNKNEISMIKGTVSQNVAIMQHTLGIYEFMKYMMNTEINNSDKEHFDKIKNHANAMVSYTLAQITGICVNAARILNNKDNKLINEIFTWDVFLEMTKAIATKDTEKVMTDIIPYNNSEKSSMLEVENKLIKLIDALVKDGTNEAIECINDINNIILQCNNMIAKFMYVYLDAVFEIPGLRNVLKKYILKSNDFKVVDDDFYKGVGFDSFIMADSLLQCTLIKNKDKSKEKEYKLIKATHEYTKSVIMLAFRTLTATKRIYSLKGITPESTPVDIFKAVTMTDNDIARYSILSIPYIIMDEDPDCIMAAHLTMMLNVDHKTKDVDFAEVIDHNVDCIGADNFWYNINRWLFVGNEIVDDENITAQNLYNRIAKEAANIKYLELNLMFHNMENIIDKMFESDEAKETAMNIFKADSIKEEESNINEDPDKGYWN